MNKIKYGIIGAGTMGRSHLECLQTIDEAELVAVADNCEGSLEKFRAVSKNMNMACYSSYHELLGCGDIDAVVICTPDFTHVDIVAAALDAGKHVLSEKPAATTIKDLERLESAVRKAKTVFQIGLECRYLPVFQRMVEMIRAGNIGRTRMLWCKEFRGPFLEKVGNWIMSKEKTGGVFVEKTCHYFDLMNWFADARPKKVIALAGQDVVKEIYGIKPDIYDNGWVIIEYENNVRASLGLCMFCDCEYDIEMGVIGENAVMEGFFAQSRLKLTEYGTQTTSDIQVRMDEKYRRLSHTGGVYFEHLAFIDNIRNNKKPLTGIEAAKWSTLVGLAAEESAEKGGMPVTF